MVYKQDPHELFCMFPENIFHMSRHPVALVHHCMQLPNNKQHRVTIPGKWSFVLKSKNQNKSCNENQTENQNENHIENQNENQTENQNENHTENQNENQTENQNGNQTENQTAPPKIKILGWPSLCTL